MPAEKTRASENRRSTKPIMEKRRRARINSSLAELKNLILDALKKDNARHSKLEKADILEMTVKHLENLQRQQMVAAITSDPTVLCKFRAGFNECANEVSRYLDRIGLDTPVRQSLLNHLSKCLTTIGTTTAPTPVPIVPIHVHRPASNPASTSETTSDVISKLLRSGVPLVPTQLSTGEIALLLPAPHKSHVSPAPQLSVTSGSPGPVHVLGSTGILSPAASDRSSTSPSPSPISPISIVLPEASYHVTNYEPISPALPTVKTEDRVWRPW